MYKVKITLDVWFDDGTFVHRMCWMIYCHSFCNLAIIHWSVPYLTHRILQLSIAFTGILNSMVTYICAVVNFSRVACCNWSRDGSEQYRSCDREGWTNRGTLPLVGCKWCQCGVAITSHNASCNPCKNKYRCNPYNTSDVDRTPQD